MKYQVDGWNNFCRVFMLPESYPKGFCFGGGRPVNFQMVDWFYPVPDVHQSGVSKKVWKEKFGSIESKEIDLKELEGTLIPFLKKKQYMVPGRKYLVLYNFGASSIFDAETEDKPTNGGE